MKQQAKTASKRLLSLDVLRGITIAGMMLVNNPGSWSYVYAPLEHAKWNGLTPTDLVFPFFMFIMGVSMFISYRKFDFKISKNSFFKLLRRSTLLFLIGLGLGWLGLTLRTYNNLRAEDMDFYSQFVQAATNFENLRILGVLQRLALVSFFGTLIILLVKPRHIPLLVAVILIGYWVLIAATNSYEMNENSIIAIVDRFVLGINHMYYDTTTTGVRIPFDPEGILSTLPCLAHVLLGFWAGKLITETADLNQKVQKLFVFGTIILFTGFLTDYGFGINKKIWSVSFVLVTCGLASQLLALLIWIIDIKGYKKWSVFFESFGVNPMFVYIAGTLLSILLGNLGFIRMGEFTSIKSYTYNNLLQPNFGNYPGSLIFAIAFLSVCWLIGHILYKKKIYIKL